MKHIYSLFAFFIILSSCGGDQQKSVEDTISSGTLKELREKRSEVDAQKLVLEEALELLDQQIAKLDTVSQKALVSVLTLKDTVFTHFLEVQGEVTTKENLIIYPQYSGVLIDLYVKAGQHVRKGQVLGKIDDGGLGQQVAQMEAQLALAKTTYERQKRLWDQKIGSEIQYLQAQTNMISQQKNVSQIKEQLAKTMIIAPFSGIIDQIITDRGQVVGPGQGLMRIVNLSDMYVTSTVPETYIGKLHKGTAVEVYLSSLGKTYSGNIRQISNNINPANRSFAIEIDLENTENLLRPNQVAKLKIIDYKNDTSIVVPSNIIKEDADGNKYVYVVTDKTENSGVAKKTILQLGQTAENVTEIMKGLSSGDVIVAEGVINVSEGTKLNF